MTLASALPSLSLATHLSLDRADSLSRLIGLWGDTGPVHVSVYLPVRADLAPFRALEARHPAAHFHPVFPSASPEETSYPVNHMRNVALEAVGTDLVMLLDVDFLPSSGLDLAKRLTWTDEMAVVLPCFWLNEPPREADGVPRTKNELRGFYETGKVSVCGLPPVGYQNVHAHHATNYTRWWREDPREGGATFPIDYEYPFEPYFVARTRCLPRFNERFAFYGEDKVEHALRMSSAGYKFEVFRSLFVVHTPHRQGRWAEWTADNKGERARNVDKVGVLLEETMKRLKDTPEVNRCKAAAAAPSAAPENGKGSTMGPVPTYPLVLLALLLLAALFMKKRRKRGASASEPV
jgi:hypothetical protein